MLDMLKEKIIARGMTLVQSPAVARLMESEQMGVVLEKAMSLPIKVSEGVQTHKEKMTALFDLATQQDLDDVKRTIARLEDVLRDIRKESGDLLRKTDSDNS